MDLNKGSLRPIGPSAADTTLPSSSSSSSRTRLLHLHLQTPLASRHPRTMMSEDYYNAWENPSEYPRIPNVYERIDDVQSPDAHNTNTRRLSRDKTKSIAVKLSIENRHQSTSLRQTSDLEDWSEHRGLDDDQTNWSVTAQLGSSYPSSDGADERRRAKRQSSFEKWRNAGDKLFCHSNKARM